MAKSSKRRAESPEPSESNHRRRGGSDDGEGGIPVLTAAERGLTMSTFADRPIAFTTSVDKQTEQLIKGWVTHEERCSQALKSLQESATNLEEAGLDDDAELFSRIDEAFRDLIDELECNRLRKKLLQNLKTASEDGQQVDLQGHYRKRCKNAVDEYTKQTPRQKYAKSKVYKEFRERHWESKGTGEAMPPLSTFFPKVKTEAGAGGDSDSDSDIEAGGMTVSFKCPISLTRLEDPWSSTVCPHSYSKANIFDYIRNALQAGERKVGCPQSGCQAKLDTTLIKPNPDLKKRVEADARRAQRQDEAQTNQADEITDEEE